MGPIIISCRRILTTISAVVGPQPDHIILLIVLIIGNLYLRNMNIRLLQFFYVTRTDGNEIEVCELNLFL